MSISKCALSTYFQYLLIAFCAFKRQASDKAQYQVARNNAKPQYIVLYRKKTPIYSIRAFLDIVLFGRSMYTVPVLRPNWSSSSLKSSPPLPITPTAGSWTPAARSPKKSAPIWWLYRKSPSSPSPSTLKPPSVTGKPTRCPTSSAVQRGPTWPWRCICDASGKQPCVKRDSSHTWVSK